MVSSALRRAVGVLLLTILNVPGLQTLTLSLDRGTSYNFSNSNNGRQSECPVCVVEGRKPTCKTSVLLQGPGSVSVDFKCAKPEDVIHLEVHRNIECTTHSCNGDIIMGEHNSLFVTNRTFVWTLKAAAPKAFLIDFTRTGLRQIHSSQACPDKHTYRLRAVGRVDVGWYCKTGPISQAQVLNQGTFSLHVPAKKPLQAGRFDVSVGEEIKSLAKIKVVLPTGSSSPVELLSPNYPQSFPDDDLVQWEFQVPRKHSATVHVVNHTQPACRKKGTAVEYSNGGRGVLVLGLTDPQPAQEKHNFTMTLKNCEMDGARGSSHGLSLHLRVTSTPSGKPVLCSVDLRQMQGLSLNLEKVRPDSECQMTMNSTAKGAFLVPSYGVAQLSFQDCSPADVWVTASRVIECLQLKDCSKKPLPLLVPSLPSCLPAPLRSITWSLVHSADGSAEILSPSDGLKRSLPGQLCNGSLVLAVASVDGRASLGTFCPGGPIRSVQFRTNASITASVDQASPIGLRLSAPESQLRAHFKEKITEDYIFTLSPNGSAPTLLASPGWPAGMQSYSSISWIVKVPAKQEAHLVFAQLSQPKCSTRHTSIRLRLLGSAEEMYSRREDEKAEGQVDAPGSFYLNMSNCMLEEGEFSMLTKMTLRKSRKFLLTVITSVVSVLLVISAVVLAVVCVVIRKKKRELSREVSIYNPAGAIFRPGESNLPTEDEYHVYASIEDTLVYTHLLKKELNMEEDADVDTYQPFTGPTDPHRPPSAVNPEVGTYRPFPGTPHIGPPVPRANRPSREQPMIHDHLQDPDGQSDLGAPEEPAAEQPALGARMEPEGSDR